MNYKDIFEKIENSLMSRMNLDREEFDKRFSDAKSLKFDNKSDDWYFDVLNYVTFYAGFNAAKVENGMELINKHFPNINTVAKYDYNLINEILKDELLIKHSGKVGSVVKNAKICLELIKEFDSIHNYLESLKPEENLENFYKNVKNKFESLGNISTFHFMSEIGLDVVKLDLILTRTFERLGLIVDATDFWYTIEQARKFSTATAYPIRYIELIFVLFGQDTEYGVCIGVPKCEICPIQEYCDFYENNIFEEDDDDEDDFEEDEDNDDDNDYEDDDQEEDDDDEDDVEQVNYYCKMEPSGEVIYAELDESEIADLRKYYKKKKMDSLDWINSPGNMGIIEHVTCMFGTENSTNTNVTDHHELPTMDGFYLLAAFLSKYSIEFNFIPSDNEPYDEDKFSTDVIEFRFGDFMEPYGEPFDYDLHWQYKYNGKVIEESEDAEMIDRGIDFNVYVFQVKDGERSMIYQNERGKVTWGKFLD